MEHACLGFQHIGFGVKIRGKDTETCAGTGIVEHYKASQHIEFTDGVKQLAQKTRHNQLHYFQYLDL